MLIDVLIIALAALAVYRGRQNGFLRQFWSSVGFFGGLAVGGLLLKYWLEPYIAGNLKSAESYAILTIVIVLGAAIAGLNAGEYLGAHLKTKLINRHFNKLDNILGSLLGVVAIIFSVWLMAYLAANLPYAGLKRSINSSHIIRGLNKLLPPAPTIIADIGRLVDPNGFPDVFVGSEPIPRGDINLPQLGEFAGAVNASKDSVVRIKGQGCGGIIAGSGFVVGRNLVTTNAHVVAGIDQPVVQDINGSHQGRVIWFDPALDLAVLRTSNLGGRPLSFDPARASSGTPAAVLGYPGGGNFSAGPAAVLSSLRASGRDIYDQQRTLRQIYEVKAHIVQGNSGGPLISKDGRVIGVIFAESTSYDGVGYALTAAAVKAEVDQAISRNQTATTGACVD